MRPRHTHNTTKCENINNGLIKMYNYNITRREMLKLIIIKQYWSSIVTVILTVVIVLLGILNNNLYNIRIRNHYSRTRFGKHAHALGCLREGLGGGVNYIMYTGDINPR